MLPLSGIDLDERVILGGENMLLKSIYKRDVLEEQASFVGL